MSFQQICNTYQQNIKHTYAENDATSELSLHTHLKTFLEKVVVLHGHDLTITHEPRRLDIGRPDFVVKGGSFPIGYVEAEAYNRNLDKLTGHAKAQNERFIRNLDNFILTNFAEFRLYTDGALRLTAHVADGSENLERLLDRFLSAGPLQIVTPEALAKYLARRTRELQTQIATTLTDENSGIYRMFSAFKELLLSTLTLSQFSDMYAQTLAYGLFAARCTLPNGTDFSWITAYNALPRSNPFLRQLFHHVASPNLEENIIYILEDIANLLRNVPTEMLRTAFTAKTHTADPVIHFYETFLTEYDPDLRVKRGVYYTPSEVISYIVRSIDSLIKTELNKPDGLADDKTLILDPATGTGGFLLTVLDHIREYITTNYGTGDWNQYVNAQLVKQIFGFEVLVAPYTIAHLKLGLFLQAHGWHATERLRIYLTNTLEEAVEKERYIFAEYISDETNAAVSVKRDAPLLVILGNPPYQRESANPSREDGKLTFIGGLIEDYKQVDGKTIKGKDQKRPLQSDYIKFIRWAEWRINKNGEGVVGYIVNNGFLDGQVFRGMRQHLIESFNAIYLLNLHGNSRREEAVPEGKTDENVFDIQQGVSILICVKKRDNSAPAKVHYADIWGNREDKYRTLSATDVQKTDWCDLQPTSPLYLFTPYRTEHRAEYEQGWEISDIFEKSSTGIFTSRDKVTIQRTEEKVHQVVSDFVSLSEVEVRKKYNLKDSKNWKVSVAQTDLLGHPDTNEHIVPIRYRPFDTRFTYYTGKSKGFHTHPAPTISPHLLARNNVALCVCRVVKSPIWRYALVTDKITEKCYLSNRTSESGYMFPLYIYENPDTLDLPIERYLNLKAAFLRALSEKLGLPQTGVFSIPQGITPQEVFAYIYAVLYSPTYRKRYNEFLKYGFPRIPLPLDIEHFRKLSTLGQTLIDWHLLQNVQVPPRHRFEGEGEGIISKIRYEGGHVWINATQHFTDVPAGVWEYEVGAYQVCEKWLRDRKGSSLKHNEVRQYCAMLVAISETLQTMQAIDDAFLTLLNGLTE